MARTKGYLCTECHSCSTQWNHPTSKCPVECWETYYGVRDGMDEEEKCICGRVAVSEYEGTPSCGRPLCEYKIQQGIDYHNERGG